ncbi:hypothetical protein B0T16DRAFT_460372 [Cercophora newfieldiana]|uniref:PLL-like beta propeller domain-containing protein n=1 Tax=Cercophora newfieldiana TaxID=92897 RepID=A0AA40CMS7_9PEZI|nr:hypothetical protein B0T16DRAFT_460372 [Cercophora newfieldiana]
MEQRRDGYVNQPDYSGLQVAPQDTAPEVDHSYSIPQVVFDNNQKVVYALAPLEPYKDAADAPQVIGVVEDPTPPTEDRRPWWRLKRWIIAIVVIVLIIVGAVVGAVIATRPDDNPTTSPASNTNTNSTQRSACRDIVCPQILASAALDAWTSSPTLLLFVRGIDNSIWYTSAAASSLAPSWPTSQRWQSLASGSPFLSQPSALTWGNGTRASVFALNDPNHMVRTAKFVDPSKIPEWELIGGPVSSVVSTCAVNGTRPDLWTSSGEAVAHNYGFGPGYDNAWNVQSQTGWPIDLSFGVKISSRPGVLCRSSPSVHDLVVYGEDGAVRHMQYSETAGWTPSTNRGGKFLGEPVVVEVNGERLDFFGIGEDKRMYHFTWTKDGGYTLLEDVGGSFQSVPSVAVTGRGSRLDVLALGANDHLQHRVLQGSRWASEWEDLGVFGNSAPLLVNMTRTEPEKVGVFVIGAAGEVNQTTWTASSDLSWKNLIWKGMGGSMTTEFYRN